MATETSTLHPGEYKITRFEIVREDDERLDIRGMVPQISIEESMEENCIRGSAVVVDKIAMLETLPLRGEERLIVEIEDVEGKGHTYDLFLYKIGDVVIANSNDGVTYTIHFCSFARYAAGLKRICKAYDTNIHEMVQDVFKESFDISSHGFPNLVPKYGKLSEPSLTESVQHLVIPNMTPIQAIDFLTRRAFSEEYSSSSFRFFENTKGFHFLNDEDVFKRAPEPFRFTFLDAIPKSGLKFNEARRNLLDMSNPKRVNTMEDGNSGGYRNEVIEIDIVKKEVVTKPFNIYDDAINSPDRLEYANADFHSREFSDKSFNEENCRKFMTIKTNVADEPGSLSPNNNLAELISSKISYRYQQEKIQISATSYGRFDVTCGDTVEIFALKNAATGNKIEINRQMSGIYIVRGVIRNFTRDNYTNTMLLTKIVSEDTKKPEIISISDLGDII